MDELTHPGEEAELQLVVFQLGKEEYAIEVSQVREIINMVDITRMPNAPAFMKGVINLRGQVVAVIDLAERLNVEPTGQPDRRVIVLELADSKVGMIVDFVSEVLRIPESSLEPNPIVQPDPDAAAVKGVIKLQNRLIILIDPVFVIAGINGWQSEEDLRKIAESE